MEKENEQRSGLSSFLPVIIMGGVMIVLMQYFFPAPEPPPPDGEPSRAVPAEPARKSAARERDYSDFEVRGREGRPERIELDTGFYHIVLNSRGGRIEAMYLRSHDELTIPAKVIEASGDPVAKETESVEVTRGNGMDFQPFLYLGDIRKYGDQLAHPTLNDLVFRVEGPETDERSGIQEVRFVLPVRLKKQNLEIVKIYRFFRGENFFRQTTVVRNEEDEEFDWGGWLFYKPFGDIGPAPDTDSSAVLATYGRFARQNGDLQQRPNLEQSGGGFLNFLSCGDDNYDPNRAFTEWTRGEHPAAGKVDFIGSNSRYFFSYANFIAGDDEPTGKPDDALFRNKIDPSGSRALLVRFRKFRLGPEGEKDLRGGSPAGNLDEFGQWLPAGKANAAAMRRLRSRTDSLVVDSQVYLGVKSDEAHQYQNVQLFQSEFGLDEPNDEARSVIYQNAFLGLFSRIRDWVVMLMRFVYGYIGNYGWTIILIATGFKLMTWPLNQMQAKSAKKMSALKPEMDRLNELYSDTSDPKNAQKKQQAVMELWKKHNINPAKGCLPMLIQMPIFIALYSAFSESVELWRSPFILWMTDLSRPDTVYVLRDFLFISSLNINILPIAMAVTQLGAQFATPTMTADPQQRMIMMFLPVVIPIFLWNMPSGVTLYWTIQNIVTIVWQFANNYLVTDDDIPTPPAKSSKQLKG